MTMMFILTNIYLFLNIMFCQCKQVRHT